MHVWYKLCVYARARLCVVAPFFSNLFSHIFYLVFGIALSFKMIYRHNNKKGNYELNSMFIKYMWVFFIHSCYLFKRNKNSIDRSVGLVSVDWQTKRFQINDNFPMCKLYVRDVWIWDWFSTNPLVSKWRHTYRHFNFTLSEWVSLCECNVYFNAFASSVNNAVWCVSEASNTHLVLVRTNRFIHNNNNKNHTDTHCINQPTNHFSYGCYCFCCCSSRSFVYSFLRIEIVHSYTHTTAQRHKHTQILTNARN